MADRELDKALDIVSVLVTGGEIKKANENAGLYEEFTTNSEVYDIVMSVMKKFNINLYEYNDGLYVSPGENNRVFGYTNDELKKELGVRLNRELYLCYFIMYNIITKFYSSSGSTTFVEYVKIEDVIQSVDMGLVEIVSNLTVMAMDEIEKDSFKEIALVWEDMPVTTSEENVKRASRGSKAGFVKLVFNFFIGQKLMIESEGRYYPKDKFKAMVSEYFEQYKGRIYEILKGDAKDATY